MKYNSNKKKVPQCLHRRYEIIDNLMNELSASRYHQPCESSSEEDLSCEHHCCNCNEAYAETNQDSRSSAALASNAQCFTARLPSWPQRCILKAKESKTSSLSDQDQDQSDSKPDITPEALGLGGVVDEDDVEAGSGLHPNGSFQRRVIEAGRVSGLLPSIGLHHQGQSVPRLNITSQSLGLNAVVNEEDGVGVHPSVSFQRRVIEAGRVSGLIPGIGLHSKRSAAEVGEPEAGSRVSAVLDGGGYGSRAVIEFGGDIGLNSIQETNTEEQPRVVTDTGHTHWSEPIIQPSEFPDAKRVVSGGKIPAKGFDLAKAAEVQLDNSVAQSANFQPAVMTLRVSNALPEAARGFEHNVSGEQQSTTCAGHPSDGPRDTTKKTFENEAGVVITVNTMPDSTQTNRTARFNAECMKKINELMLEQRVLVDEIRRIEYREKQGMKLLQQADEMWTHMDNNYKTNLKEVMERKENLLCQVSEVSKSTKKWKNMKKDLESQIDSVEKTIKGMDDRYRHRMNDIRCLDKQIANMEKTIDASKREMETTEKNLMAKKKHADHVADTIGNKLNKLTADVTEECKNRAEKERSEVHYINQSRNDLPMLWKDLLQRKLQNEELKVKEQTLMAELNHLKNTELDCKDRCFQKEVYIKKELEQMEEGIAFYKGKCSRCNQAVDTRDINKTCVDCPRCAELRRYMQSGDVCKRDLEFECVCEEVKGKFMENVFENMNAVLQQQVDTEAGRALGDAVLECLKHSKTGKVDEATKMVLKDFILTTVRKHLNTTIVGGAVKTRCEMDPDTYNMLMNCINETELPRTPMEDKSTTKKSPCKHWKGNSECNCADGPKDCLCANKVPYIPTDKGKDKDKEPAVYSMYKSNKRPCKIPRTNISVQSSYEMKPLALMTSHGIAPSNVDIAKELVSQFCGAPSSACYDQTSVNVTEPGVTADSVSSQGQNSATPSIYESCRDSDTVQGRSQSETDTNNNNYYHSYIESNLKLNKKNRHLSFSEYVTNDNELSEVKSRNMKNEKIVRDKWVQRQTMTKRRQIVTKYVKGKEDDIIELTRSPSGNQALAFDKNVIDIFYRKLNNSSSLQVYLKKISDKRFRLRMVNDNKEDYEMVKIRRTQSGTLLLDGPKLMLLNSNSTQKNADNKTDINNCYNRNNYVQLCRTKYNIPINASMRKDCNKTNCSQLRNKEAKNKSNYHIDGASVDSDSDRPSRQRRDLPSGSFMKAQVYNVTIKPDYKNVFLKIISKQLLTERKSGDIRDQTNGMPPADVTSDKKSILKAVLNRIKHKSDNRKDQLLQKKCSPKGEFRKKTVTDLFYNEAFNPPIQNALSGNTFVVETCNSRISPNVTSLDVLMESDKISQSHSGSYLYIEQGSVDHESSIKDITPRGTYSNLNSSVRCEEFEKPSVEINKTNDFIKVSENQKEMECIFFKQNAGKSQSGHERQLPAIINASSDFPLPQEKCKSIKNNKDCLLSLTSKSIKKTDSGTYNLILDKYSKQRFISNVQGMVKNAKGSIPVLKKDNGDMQIQLNQGELSKNEEYLRITASGSLYFSVDKNRVNGVNDNKVNLKNNSGSPVRVEKLDHIFSKYGCEPKVIHSNIYRRTDKNHPPQNQLSNDVLTSNDDCRHSLEANKPTYDLCSDCDCMSHNNKDWYCAHHSPYDIEFHNRNENSLDVCNDQINKKNCYVVTTDKKPNTNIFKEIFWNNVDKLPPQLPAFLKDYNIFKRNR